MPKTNSIMAKSNSISAKLISIMAEIIPIPPYTSWAVGYSIQFLENFARISVNHYSDILKRTNQPWFEFKNPSKLFTMLVEPTIKGTRW